MEIKGTIPPFTILDVLQIINENKLTGELTLNDSINMALLFKNGYLIYIDLLDSQKKPSDASAITKSLNLLKKIRNVNFQFKKNNKVSDIKTNISIPIEVIIFEIARGLEITTKDLVKVGDEFTPEKTKNYKAMLSTIDLSLEEIKILNAIDGKKNVKDIINSLKEEIEETKVRKILYGFLASGIIKRAKKEFKIDLKSISLEFIRNLIKRLVGT